MPHEWIMHLNNRTTFTTFRSRHELCTTSVLLHWFIIPYKVCQGLIFNRVFFFPYSILTNNKISRHFSIELILRVEFSSWLYNDESERGRFCNACNHTRLAYLQPFCDNLLIQFVRCLIGWSRCQYVIDQFNLYQKTKNIKTLCHAVSS